VAAGVGTPGGREVSHDKMVLNNTVLEKNAELSRKHVQRRLGSGRGRGLELGLKCCRSAPRKRRRNARTAVTEVNIWVRDPSGRPPGDPRRAVEWAAETIYGTAQLVGGRARMTTGVK